jgi:hypothetical protein
MLNDDFVDKLNILFDDMIVNEALPTNAIYLHENKSRVEGGKIASWTVSFFEPDYPPSGNNVADKGVKTPIVNLKKSRAKEDIELLVKKGNFKEIELPQTATIKEVKYDKEFVHVQFKVSDPNAISYIKGNINLGYKKYVSQSSFGCCSVFNKCSDEKRCVHINKLYSKGCMYRRNLDDGKIFYGKNRNVN